MEEDFCNSQDESDDSIEDDEAYLLNIYDQAYDDQETEDEEDQDEDDQETEDEDDEDQEEDDDDIEDAYLLDDEDHADFIDDAEMVLSPSVLHDGSTSYLVEENRDSQRSIEVNGEGVVGELNRSEIEDMSCPICMEAWTNGGDHQICCLPCGHLYGFSCIKRWFQQHRSLEKCPLCNRKCSLNDVRVLYASKIVAVDQELQKKVRSLEAKCVSLEKKDAEWCKKEVEWHLRAVDLYLQIDQLTEELRTAKLELGESVAQQECNEMKKMMDKMEERLK